jgi:hypothetical protein
MDCITSKRTLASKLSKIRMVAIRCVAVPMTVPVLVLAGAMPALIVVPVPVILALIPAMPVAVVAPPRILAVPSIPPPILGATVVLARRFAMPIVVVVLPFAPAVPILVLPPVTLAVVSAMPTTASVFVRVVTIPVAVLIPVIVFATIFEGFQSLCFVASRQSSVGAPQERDVPHPWSAGFNIDWSGLSRTPPAREERDEAVKTAVIAREVKKRRSIST